MVELAVLAASAALFGALFLAFRSTAYPTSPTADLPHRAAAVRQAAEAAARLCGVDVSGWRSYSVLWFDDATTDALHRIGRADRQGSFPIDWGLRGSWRVRFFADGGSVLVGLSPRGDVVLFDLTGDVRDEVVRAAAAAPEVDDDIRHLLGPAGSGVWFTTRPVGAGYRERADGSTERSRRFRAAGRDLRVEMAVDVVGGCVVRVDSTIELTAGESAAEDRANQRETIAHLGGVLGSVLAFAGGVAIITFAGGNAPAWLLPLLIGPLVLAVLHAQVSGFRSAAVQSYDGTLSWPSFRAVTCLVSVVTAATMTGVVVVAVLAGAPVASRVDLNITGQLGRQLAWGGWVAFLWLGIAATAYGLLRSTGLARVTPSPDGRSMRMTGVDLRHVLSVATQSAIGEEAVLRLLALPVLIWLTDSIPLAVAVSALLWAAMHSGGMVRPRAIRFVELTVIGVVLGVVTVEIGFLAALTAHALYNTVILVGPLTGTRRPHADVREVAVASPSGGGA